ncbi:hypothetical protein ACFV1L_10465 [Kitasatospora sp. NPDC059646]|uniref:hypothetical protein n=1 Tax=Kitasatospora sp. NPDC059646 TaxID=3346893 RepID=UPI0036AA6867
MSEYVRDSFGVDIEPGDYILSASTTHGRVKVGRAKAGRTGKLVMTVDVSAQHGEQEETHPKTGQLGYNVVVLRKADGSVPTHVGGPGNWLTVDGVARQVTGWEFRENDGDDDVYRVYTVPLDDEAEGGTDD